ncbi:hypothetical protein PQG22_11575 [Aquirufa beregesia]
MKNNKPKSPKENLFESNEKRIWVSPEITNWENENIENAGGLGGDGGTQTYL